MIRVVLLLLLFSYTGYAKTLDAGNIVAEIDAWGDVSDMFWPKGPDQENRVWNIHTGLAHDQTASYTNYSFTSDNDSITYDGFFENTIKAAQEVRTISLMKIEEKPIRMRTSFRAYGEGSSRANEIEMVYEFRNQTLDTLNDFYYGTVLDVWVPYTYNYGSWTFDAGGNLIFEPNESNEGATYVHSNNMFWFGYEQEEFYVAILVAGDSSDPVHTASIYDYFNSGSTWYPSSTLFSAGTKPDSVIDMTDITDPVVFFSLKNNSLEPNEKVYMKVIISFAKSSEELLGSVNRILSSTKVPVDPVFTASPKEGTFTPPKAETAGGCFIKNIKKALANSKKSKIKKETKKKTNPFFDFKLRQP